MEQPITMIPCCRRDKCVFLCLHHVVRGFPPIWGAAVSRRRSGREDGRAPSFVNAIPRGPCTGTTLKLLPVLPRATERPRGCLLPRMGIGCPNQPEDSRGAHEHFRDPPRSRAPLHPSGWWCACAGKGACQLLTRPAGVFLLSINCEWRAFGRMLSVESAGV